MGGLGQAGLGNPEINYNFAHGLCPLPCHSSALKIIYKLVQLFFITIFINVYSLACFLITVCVCETERENLLLHSLKWQYCWSWAWLKLGPGVLNPAFHIGQELHCFVSGCLPVLYWQETGIRN